MPIRYRIPKKSPKPILTEKDLVVKKLRKDKPENDNNEEKLPDLWEKDMGEDENYQEWLEQQNKYSCKDIDEFIKKAIVDENSFNEDSINFFISKVIENIIFSSGSINLINPDFITDLFTNNELDEPDMGDNPNVDINIDPNNPNNPNNIDINLIKTKLNKFFPIKLRKKIESLDDSNEDKKILIKNYNDYIKQFKNELDTINWELELDQTENNQ